ncbi:hypothetical protein SAY87_016115 [Trapa incisa]|uniref:GDSL esterase/lipase n=1 Tax=Trapa incisa TaxID=236973 RepID=A0AAN7L8N4_9MYRT|nr:hypothetical protein SAY87_016115 [Trapa incisa]
MKNLKARRGGANNHMDRTLFWLGSIGAHDFNRIHRSGTFSPEWITQNTIDHVHKLIQGMVKQGGKFFVIQGLPPIGCLPMNQVFSPRNEKDRFGCALRINKAVKHHNVLLQKKLHELQKLFPNCVFVNADMWMAFTKVLSSHRKFGFLEPFKACCGSGGGLFYFNPKKLCGTSHASVLCPGRGAYDLGLNPPQPRHAQGPCQAPHPWWLHASFPPHAHQVQEGPHP